jgi:hypothetical protein
MRNDCLLKNTHDNICMNVNEKFVPEEKRNYFEWYNDDTCKPMQFKKLVLRKNASKYIESVPDAHRQPYKWGWKHPNTLY